MPCCSASRRAALSRSLCSSQSKSGDHLPRVCTVPQIDADSTSLDNLANSLGDIGRRCAIPRLDIGGHRHVDARCYDGDLAHHRLSAYALAITQPAAVGDPRTGRSDRSKTRFLKDTCARRVPSIRRFGSKPDKKIVDGQAASPSSWKTPCIATRMVW